MTGRRLQSGLSWAPGCRVQMRCGSEACGSGGMGRSGQSSSLTGGLASGEPERGWPLRASAGQGWLEFGPAAGQPAPPPRCVWPRHKPGRGAMGPRSSLGSVRDGWPRGLRLGTHSSGYPELRGAEGPGSDSKTNWSVHLKGLRGQGHRETSQPGPSAPSHLPGTARPWALRSLAGLGSPAHSQGREQGRPWQPDLRAEEPR